MPFAAKRYQEPGSCAYPTAPLLHRRSLRGLKPHAPHSEKKGKIMALLDPVKTLVIVMMENRSFDHMLGYLSLLSPAMKVDGLATPDGSTVDYRVPLTKLENDSY